MFINSIKGIIDRIYPFYGSAILLFIVLILLFFCLSSRTIVKVVFLGLSVVGLIGAIAVNIMAFLSKGSFSDYLFSYDLLELIKTTVILFIAVNLIILISLHKFGENNYNKILLLFLLSVIVFTFYVPSSNFVMIFSSLVMTVAGIFILFTTLNNNMNYKISEEYALRNQTVRFFLITLFSLVLMFAGFSVIFGATDLKSFLQLIETEKIISPMIKAGLVMMFGAMFIFLFIFPLQSAYIKLLKRCDSASAAVVWFLYYPAGFILLLKMRRILFYFLKSNFYVVCAIYLVAFVLIVAGNIGAIRTGSIRRVLSFIFLAVIGISFLPLGFYGSGMVSESFATSTLIMNITISAIAYFSFYSFASEIESKRKSDSITNFYGFIKRNKYPGVVILAIIVIFPLILLTGGGILQGELPVFLKNLLSASFPGQTANSGNFILNYTGAGFLTAGTIFLMANIIRLIVLATTFKAEADSPGESGVLNSTGISKFQYFYGSFYLIIMIYLLAGSILQFFGLSILPASISAIAGKL
jgi:NADH:ubiquinone oxidoreductase subunit 2 (subunit N)